MTAPQTHVMQTVFEFGVDEVMRTLEELQREERELFEAEREWEEADRYLVELEASAKAAWEEQLRLGLGELA